MSSEINCHQCKLPVPFNPDLEVQFCPFCDAKLTLNGNGESGPPTFRPPTPHQIRYAKFLGIAAPENIDRAVLTLMIDKAQREFDRQIYGRPMKRSATERQKRFARDLGIRFPDEIGKKALSILIDEEEHARRDAQYPRLAGAPIHAILSEIARQGDGAAIITFDLDDAAEVLDADDIRDGRLAITIHFSEDVPEECRGAIEDALGTS